MSYEDAKRLIKNRDGHPYEDDWDLAEAANVMLEVDRKNQLTDRERNLIFIALGMLSQCKNYTLGGIPTRSEAQSLMERFK